MEAFLLLAEKHKLVAENSGILPLAGLKKLECRDKKVVAIVSGGNIDVLTISSMINKGLVLRGRIFTFSVNLPDNQVNWLRYLKCWRMQMQMLLNSTIISSKTLTVSMKLELQVTVETNG